MVIGGVVYSVLDGEVLAVDAVSGDVLWHGQPEDAPAVAALAVPESRDGVVLLDYMQRTGVFPNLVRIGPDGDVLWRAQLPTAEQTEAYVDAELNGFTLSAVSWTGHRVEVDLATGLIISREFVK